MNQPYQEVVVELNEESTALATPVIMELNPAVIYLSTLRPTGRRSMRQALDVMSGILSSGKLNALTFPWHSLRYQHTAALRAALGLRYQPATLNKMLSALRRVMKEAWRLGLMDAEEYRRAIDLPNVRNDTLPSGRALSGAELRALLACCQKDKTPIGARDAALLAVIYGAGLRRSEVVKLLMTDFDPEDRSLRIRGGKGGKDRITYLPSWSVEVLEKWFRQRGDSGGVIFCPVDKKGTVHLRLMTDQAVMKRLKSRAVEAGINTFSPHDLRRTFISDLLDAGADIATVQKLVGHSSVQTTARYDRRGEVAKRKAADLLGKITQPDFN